MFAHRIQAICCGSVESERLSDGVADQTTLRHWGKIAKTGAGWEVGLHELCHPDSEPGLPGTARAGECDQTVVLNQLGKGARVNLAAHERCELGRQVTAW